MPTSTMNVESVVSETSGMVEERDNPGTLLKQSDAHGEDLESLQKNTSIDRKEEGTD